MVVALSEWPSCVDRTWVPVRKEGILVLASSGSSLGHCVPASSDVFS